MIDHNSFYFIKNTRRLSDFGGGGVGGSSVTGRAEDVLCILYLDLEPNR